MKLHLLPKDNLVYFSNEFFLYILKKIKRPFFVVKWTTRTNASCSNFEVFLHLHGTELSVRPRHVSKPSQIMMAQGH